MFDKKYINLSDDKNNSMYIDVKEIKFVLKEIDRAIDRMFRSNAFRNNKLYSCCSKEATMTLVVLRDDTVIRSPVETDKLSWNISENGHKLLKVDEGYFIAVDYLKFVCGADSVLAASILKNSPTKDNDLTFIRQKEKKQSLLLLSTGEIIWTRKYPQEIIDSI